MTVPANDFCTPWVEQLTDSGRPHPGHDHTVAVPGDRNAQPSPSSLSTRRPGALSVRTPSTAASSTVTR